MTEVRGPQILPPETLSAFQTIYWSMYPTNNRVSVSFVQKLPLHRSIYQV